MLHYMDSFKTTENHKLKNFLMVDKISYMYKGQDDVAQTCCGLMQWFDNKNNLKMYKSTTQSLLL